MAIYFSIMVGFIVRESAGLDGFGLKVNYFSLIEPAIFIRVDSCLGIRNRWVPRINSYCAFKTEFKADFVF